MQQDRKDRGPKLTVCLRVRKTHAAIVDSINSGEIPVETAAITALVTKSASASDSSNVNFFMIVLGACWLIGIIQEKTKYSNARPWPIVAMNSWKMAAQKSAPMIKS